MTDLNTLATYVDEQTDGCIFCHDQGDRVATSPRFYARRDGYPLTPGHTLIIPKRHVVSFFDLNPDEAGEAFELLKTVRADLERELGASDYNIGINDGRTAGRTVDHPHIHLIPRRPGDIGDPRGGVRNMLPGPSPDLWASR